MPSCTWCVCTLWTKCTNIQAQNLPCYAIRVMRMYYYVLLWPILYICIVYIASVTARFGTVQSALTSDFPFSIQLLLFGNLPLEVLFNSSALTGALFIINTVLVATYVTLLVYLIRSRITRYKKVVGAAGSVLAILSVGCAACGSLITPALIVISGAVPLSLFGHVNIVLIFLSTILLLFALRFLIKRIRE